MNDLRRYQEIRDEIRPGDLFAFSGEGRLSKLIRWVTQSGVSHVGAVKYRDMLTPERIDLVESTILSKDGRKGVRTRRLSDVLRGYDGSAIWIPLRRHLPFDQARFFGYMMSQEGRPYGALQAVMAGLRLPTPKSETRQFCSELIAFGYQKAGALDTRYNPSGITPAELVRFPIYTVPVVLVGKAFPMPGFNEGWEV